MVFDIVKREKHETLLRIVPSGGRSGLLRSGAASGVTPGRGAGMRAAKAVFPSLCTDRDLSSSVEDGGGLTEVQGRVHGLAVMAGYLISGFRPPAAGPASSGSDQAHEGRLVDALAIRGDEGRGTLR
jgi:hypothetical protein